MAEGDFPKVDGDVFFASEVNTFRSRILEIYTATGFNSSSSSSASGSDSDSFNVELTPTTFGVVKPTYLKITMNATISVNAQSQTSTAGSATGSIKIEIKDIGGSYSEVYNQPVAVVSLSDTDRNTSEDNSFVFLHTLTANEKANGFQIKMTGTTSTTNSGSASVTNRQIIVEQIS